MVNGGNGIGSQELAGYRYWSDWNWRSMAFDAPVRKGTFDLSWWQRNPTEIFVGSNILREPFTW